MPQHPDLKARIDALCTRAAAERPDARLLVEIEDALAEGYVRALQGDQLCRHLEKRLEALTRAVDSPEELLEVARERHMVAEDTRELRSQLAVMRERWVSLGSRRLGLA